MPPPELPPPTAAPAEARRRPWTRWRVPASWRLGTRIGVLLALSMAVPLAVAEAFTSVLARSATQERTAALLTWRAEQRVNDLDDLNRLHLVAVGRLAWTPVALAMPGDQERAFAAEFDAYLTKPLERRALEAALADLPRRRGATGRGA